jgi:hypothetical protein
MKTPLELLDELAREHRYTSWYAVYTHHYTNIDALNMIPQTAAQRYSAQFNVWTRFNDQEPPYNLRRVLINQSNYFEIASFKKSETSGDIYCHPDNGNSFLVTKDRASNLKWRFLETN